MRIYWKFYFLSLAIVLSSVGTLALLIGLRESRRAVERFREQQKVKATLVASQVEAAYFEQKWPFETLDVLARDEDFEAWRIVDGRGTVVLSSSAAEVGTPSPMRCPPGTTEPVLLHGRAGQAEMWDVPLRMRTGGAPWCFQMSFRTALAVEQGRRILLINLAVAAAVAVVLLPLSVFFTGRILEPLRQLATAAERMGQGHADVKLPPPSEDEVGKLVAAFEAMAKSLSARDEEIREKVLALARARDELEVRVRERTAELTHANEELHREMADRRRMETELQQSQKLKSIGQLAAGIAHEINTPAQYVGDNARFLEDSFSDLVEVLNRQRQLLEAVKEGAAGPKLIESVESAMAAADLDYLLEEIPRAIQQSREGIERVAAIVAAMKDFSYPSGAEKMPVDLNRSIASTITVARNEWKYVAELETDFDESLPLVSCLPGEFNQVILNLIINAAHAVEEQLGEDRSALGKITVGTRRDGMWVEIVVSDTGTGVPEGIRDRIFEPFFTTKEVGKGTGQGLAVCYAVIVEKHGGTIRFESETGRGTRFIVRLPILPGAVEEEREASHAG